MSAFFFPDRTHDQFDRRDISCLVSFLLDVLRFLSKKKWGSEGAVNGWDGCVWTCTGSACEISQILLCFLDTNGQLIDEDITKRRRNNQSKTDQQEKLKTCICFYYNHNCFYRVKINYLNLSHRSSSFPCLQNAFNRRTTPSTTAVVITERKNYYSTTRLTKKSFTVIIIKTTNLSYLIRLKLNNINVNIK